MKQLYKYILTLATIFMATTSAWAQCYVLNEPSEVKIGLNDDKEYSLTGPGSTLTFDARKGGYTTGPLRIDQYVNGNWENEILSINNNSLHSSDFYSFSCTLKPQATKVRFYNEGSLNKVFKNVKVTMATYVDAPMAGGALVTEWNAGTDIVGNSVQASATIDWSNTTFSWELVNNTDNQFSVSFSSTGETCEYGTSNITATYHRTKPGNHSATLKIYTVSGNYEIKLSGETGKYTPLAEKKQDLIMNTSYDPSEVFKVYYRANNIENPIQDYTITALDPTIANYVNGQIVTNYHTGTARFSISRSETDDCKELTSTIITLTVNTKEENCVVLETEYNKEYVTGYNDNREGFLFNLSGYGDLVSLEIKKQGAATDDGYIYIIGYDKNGENETRLATIRNTEISTSYTTHSCIIQDNTITQIRIKSSEKPIDDALAKFFRNVCVTRKQFLNPQIDGEIFYLTQTTSGMQFAGTFPLEWSTCSDNISLMCDNPNFTIIPTTIDASDGQGTTAIVVAYSTEEENPNLTGTLTIYDQSQTKQITLSCEHMLQTIDWPQYFYNLEADENGYINEDITLNAIARTVTGQPTNQPIHYTLNVSPANASLSTDANGNTHLNITGICEGTITASVEGFTDTNGRTYSANSAMREIRVRKWGDKCNTHEMISANEIALSEVLVWLPSEKVFELDGRPYERMEFYSHVSYESMNNNLTISFSTDGGSTWSNSQTFNIPKDYDWNTPFVHSNIPEGANRAKFKTSSTTNTYIYGIEMVQKTYLEANVTEIRIDDAIVNTPFSREFVVKYSDIPFLQYVISDSHNLGLKLTSSPTITNNCGDWGEYTFTLTGMSPYPQENVTETITLYTSTGDELKIPVIITSRLSDIYYFDKQDGDWSDLNNWRVNDNTPTSLPTPSNPVIITKAASIGTNDTPFEGIAYSIDIQQGGSITVLPKGGLTVHAGGFTGASEQNLTIHNMQSGAGFIRISPYFTKEVTGTMPKAKVLYQTKSTLDTGANKDATWQYIGAPGTDCSIYVDYNTWLYKLDEPNADWVLQPRTADVALEPFEGYAITQYGQPTYQWTAQLTNQSQTLPLTYSKAGRSGRHIFANSFAAPIDVKQLSGLITYADGQDSRFRIEQTVYIFNSGSWNAWNTKPQMGDDTPGQYYAIPILAAAANYLADEQTVIPLMQGFYMRVRSRIPTSELSATENVGQILLDYNKLVMGNQHELNTPLRLPQRVEETPDFQRVRMYATSANSGADRLYVIQDTINTRKYNNGYDAPNQETKGLVNIYTNESFGKMEVSCSDNIDSLYIGFMAGEDSNYTLHFGALCGEIYLKDLENDSIFLMQDGGQYSFTATPNSTNDLRFQILLNPDIDSFPGNGDINSSINNIPSMQVWMDDNTIYIANAPINSVATLFNISGHAILTTPIRYTPYSLNLSHMPQGVYVLKINNEAYKFVCK